MTIMLTMGFSSASEAAWRTCLKGHCSQEQATFDTWQECAQYQKYRGKNWNKCFEV